MPKLLNLWYEKLCYPKILPLVYNLSMKNFMPLRPLAHSVPPPHENNEKKSSSRLVRNLATISTVEPKSPFHRVR
jgi:hypothetical protein